jgi:hypothetical protein
MESQFTARELTAESLSDFEHLFDTRPAPGAHRCWCLHHHCADSSVENRARMRKFVESGEAQGMLVYSGTEPVGWCQFGRARDLPRMNSNPAYRMLAATIGAPDWRITCFTVRAPFRRQGVASLALRKALEFMNGGIIEAYPVLDWSGYAKYRGTAAMFSREGFTRVAPLGASAIVARRDAARPA